MNLQVGLKVIGFCSGGDSDALVTGPSGKYRDKMMDRHFPTCYNPDTLLSNWYLQK